MKRRNFVIGLGTVATVSGAVSVTAASLAESVTANADFQVIVDRNLTIRRGEGFDDTQEEYRDSPFTHGDLDGDDLPVAYVNDQADDALEMALAIANEEDGDLADLYTEILELENAGAATETVAMEFNYGADVGGGAEEVSEQTVAELFQFEIDETRISPDPSSPGDEGDWYEIDPVTTEQIDLTINIDEAVVDEIADAADVTGNPFDGDSDEVDLLDSVVVGIQDDEA